MKLPVRLLTTLPLFLVAAAHHRRKKSAVAAQGCNPVQELRVVPKIERLKRLIDADELKLEGIERRFQRLAKRANRFYRASGQRIDIFFPSNTLSRDLPEIHRLIRIPLHAFFDDFKRSCLYPGLLDEREEAGNRREREKRRMLSMSPEEFVEDYNERYCAVVEYRETCLKEHARAVQELAAEEARRTEAAHAAGYASESGCEDTAIDENKEKIKRYSCELEKCDHIIAHCRDKIDAKFASLPFVLGKHSFLGLYKSYITTLGSLDKKKHKYAELHKNAGASLLEERARTSHGNRARRST